MNRFLQIILVASAISSCNPDRDLMPITTSSDEAMEIFERGRHLIENAEFVAGDSVLLKAIALDSNFAMAHLYRNQGMGVEKARSLSNTVSRGERLLIEALYQGQNRNYQLAQVYYDSLLAIHPKDKHCLYFAAWKTFSLDPERSIQLLKKSIKIDPHYIASYNLLGYAYMALERYGEAEVIYKEYLNYYPESSNAIDSYAEFLIKTGKYKEALKQLNRFLEIDPQDLYIYEKIAWVHIYNEEFDKAFAISKDLYSIASSDYDREWAVYMMANARFIEGRYHEALKVMDDYPVYFETQHQNERKVFKTILRAWFSFREGEYDTAIKDFFQAIDTLGQLDSFTDMGYYAIAIAHSGLSFVYTALNQLELSEEHLSMASNYFEKASPHAFFQSVVYTAEAAILIERGDFESALGVYRVASVGSIKSFYLAKTYDLLGNTDKAIKLYKNVIHSFDPYWAGFYYTEANERIKELNQLL